MTHKDLKDLDQLVSHAKKDVTVGGIYYHYKNPKKYYVVEAVGFIENTEELCVIYRALYDKGIVWVRTLANFTENVMGSLSWTKRFMQVDNDDL